MAKQNQAAGAQPDKKQQSKTGPANIAEPANGAASFGSWAGALFDAAGQGPATRLGDPRLQTAQRQALAAKIGQVQGNHHLQRAITSLQQEQPLPKIQPRLARPAYIARKEGDQPKAETPASPARAAGLSFSLSGVHYRVQEGATFQPGPRGPQVMAVCLQALLGSRYTPGLENEVFREYSAQVAGGEYYPWMSGVAKQVEPFPYKSVHMHASHAGGLVKLLQNQFKLTVKLSEEQQELLSLGTSVETAWDRLHQPDMAQMGVTFPQWYDEYLFARQLAQYTDLLGQFNKARKQLEAAPSQETRQTMLNQLQHLGQTLLARAKVWEAIRTDKKLGSGPEHKVVEMIHNDKTFLTMFLNYTATQPAYAEQALTEHAARVELLKRFVNYARRTLGPTDKGDEALAKQPARANAPRLPAKLSSFPQVGPPLFDAALGTDHTFLMNIEYPDLFEAFGLWVYKWEYLLVPPQKPGEKPADLDEVEGKTPGWGEVYSARLDHAQQYAQADIERVTNELGPVGIAAAGMVEINNILRYGGTVVKTFIESVFQPKYEQKFVFPSEGLYLVRCRAVRASGKDAEVVRTPSVAYTLVYARDPNWMAQTRVQMSVKAVASAKERLAELEAELAKNPDQPELRKELQELKLTLGPLGPIQAQQRQAFVTRISELKKQIQQAKATGTSQIEFEQELKTTEKQLKNLDKRIKNRSQHAGLHRPGANPERLIASFVSDTGQTVKLDLEAVEVARGENQFKYYVADSTTPDSDDETGKGKTRAEAILDALRTILEGSGGYGRGRVSIHIDGQIYTRRIEASLGNLLGEAVENISNILAIAAVAAAPFTGGTSLVILLPAGAIGAIPAAYRLVDRGLEGRLKWDLATLMDIVNVAGALAGVTQLVATPLRLVRVGKGAMIFGVGTDGLGALLIPVAIVKQLEALEGLPPGERAARTMMIIGGALKEVGMMGGQALVRRALEMQAHPDFKPDGETGGETSGTNPKGGEGEAGDTTSGTKAKGTEDETSPGAGGETSGAKPKSGEGEASPGAGDTTPGAKAKGSEGEASSGAGDTTPGAKAKGSEGEAGSTIPGKPKGDEGETSPADLDLTSPDWYREARTRMEAGGARGQQAAEIVIRDTPDWKGVLRYRTEPGGDLGPGSRTALDQARRAMVDEARSKVKQNFPEIVIRDVGSRGFNSDIDVTFNPPEPGGLSDPAAVAQAVERSGQAARQFMAELRHRSGGEPEVSLDTNAYIYTGMESAMPIPADQAGAVAHVMDVTSLVEIRRGLQTGDPDGAQATWNKFKKQTLLRVTPKSARKAKDNPQQAQVAAQVKERLEQQLVEAEAMYERVVALEAETRQRLTKSNGPMDPESLVARTSEVAVEQRQQELVNALRQEPIDHIRVRQLQAEIKLLERGAYATRAAVADVVDHQQTSTSADRAAGPGETVKHRTTGEEMTQGAPVRDPRLLTQSAGSTLGQMLAHLQAGESLMGQLKAVAKYCYRIDHAREQLGMHVDVPEIRNNFTHAKLFGSGDLGSDGVLARMVQQWAAANNLAKAPFEQQAQAYINSRTQWAKEAIIGLRIRTESEAAIKGELASLPPATGDKNGQNGGSPGEPASPATGPTPASQAPQGRPASPEAELARIGPVSEATRSRLDQQPELRQALAEHPHVANLLKQGEPPNLPPQATPAQIRQLAALLTEMEAAGFQVKDPGYQNQLRKYFHEPDNFNNLSPALAKLEQAFQTNRLRHMTQQDVIRMAQEGENIPLEPPARSEVKRASQALKNGSATRQDVEILLRQIVADYRAYRTADLKKMMARSSPKRKHLVPTHRLTADTLKLECGMGRDLTAESLQSLTLNSPAPVRIERYQIHDFLPNESHGFNIITLPGGGRYIVDPTFAQFMHADRPNYKGDPLLGQNATLETAQFVRDLLRDGFIPLTPERAYHYARSLGASESQAHHIADSLMNNKGSILTEIIANGQISRYTTTPQDAVIDMDLRNLSRTEEGDVTLRDMVTGVKDQADLDPGMRKTLQYLQNRLNHLAGVRKKVPIVTEEKDE